MTASYIAVSRQFPWLVDSLEQAFSEMQDGALVDPSWLARTISGRLPTHDELAATLLAFADLTVLAPRSEGTYQLRREQLSATAEYRRGVHDALTYMAPEIERQPVAKLCIALPLGLPMRIKEALRQEATDLRSMLVDLIAGSKHEILLASPFWDAETVADLAQLVEQRLEAGVSVTILGRFGPNTVSTVKVSLARLSRFDSCRILDWYERSEEDPFGSQTFHFKAVVSDAGERAYLGTANFTTSSLRSRMEMGYILSGAPAFQLARVLDTVVHMARPAALAND
jgi:phosphatidylserine/phosphatidylglycerophosphate/cardiolipin synthase-like enzyme